MIGKPLYKQNEKVKFTINGIEVEGSVYIIDAYGTFEQNEEVSYDVMLPDKNPLTGEPCLVKHIRESSLKKC